MLISYAQYEISTAEELVLLAVDDFSIPSTRNLCLHMEKPDKHPDNPVVARGLPGSPDAHRASLFGTVLFIDGKFRMWYNAIPELTSDLTRLNNPKTHEEIEEFLQKLMQLPVYVAYAESDDGVNWVKPVLELVEFNGNKHNNLVDVEGGGGHYCAVLYEENEENPDYRYKMVFEKFYDFKGWSTERERITGYFTSPDGLSWKELHSDQFICQQTEIATLYKFNNKYHISGHQIAPLVYLPPDGMNSGRAMVTWDSNRFDAWPEEKTVSFFKPVRSSAIDLPWDREEVHLGAAVWSRGNVCIGIYGQWHGPSTKDETKVCTDLGVIISNDGIHFREPAPGFSLIQRDQEKAWDREASINSGDNILLVQGNAFINKGDKTYIWYTASTPHGNTLISHDNIGLATLRRDGFGYYSLHPDAKDGSLITCMLQTEGDSFLYLNIEGVGQPQNQVLIQLVEEDGFSVIAGYSEHEIQPVAQNGIRVRVNASDGNPLIMPRNCKFRVRLVFRGRAKLYSLYISQEVMKGYERTDSPD